jgi:hypothetical protein
MRRREFLGVLGGAAMAWPQTVMGQGPKGRRLIGRLSFASRDAALRYTGRFLEGMRELGYAEGRDFDMAYGMANFDTDRLPRVAAQLVELAPDVILAGQLSKPLPPEKRRTGFRSLSVRWPIPSGSALPQATLGRSAMSRE